MQVTRTDTSSTDIKLLISASETDLLPIKNEVVKRLSKNIKLPGFRSGKAPQALIEKNIDQSQLQGDFLDEAMTQLYARATREENIQPVTRPEVIIKKFVPFTDLEYEVSTSIIGKLKLTDYKKIKVKKDEVKVTAKDVSEVIESLRTRLGEKEETKAAAKDGDEVTIDFSGTDEKNQAIEGAGGADYPLTLGSNSFIPGFEEKLIGLKSGQEKSFDLTFPKDYAAKNLATKKVTFKVTVKKVNKLTLPKISDEMASKVGPFKSLSELKADVEKQLKSEREREASSKQQNEILKAIAEKSHVDIPMPLIEQQVTYGLDDLKRNLAYKGQTFPDFLEQLSKTEEQYKKELEPEATEQIKASLILAEIAEKEGLSVTTEEVEARIVHLKTHYNDAAMQAELDKPENKREIASRMMSEKVMNFLTSAK